MKFYTEPIAKSPRISKLVEALYEKMPRIEADRAVLLTESYKATEGEPIITRRAKAFAHILEHIPIIIRDNELIVGSATKAPRGCQVFPEYSFEWLESEFDTVETRVADPFYISEDTKETLAEVYKYWKGKTTSELATSYMSEEAKIAIDHGMFTPGNYFYNGIGHVTVDYPKVLAVGYRGILEEVKAELKKIRPGDADYAKRKHFLDAVVISCEAAIKYAKRYSDLALSMAKTLRQSAEAFPKTEPRASTRLASPSGSFKCFCRSNPADTRSPPVALTNICILIIKRIWMRAGSAARMRRS